MAHALCSQGGKGRARKHDLTTGCLAVLLSDGLLWQYVLHYGLSTRWHEHTTPLALSGGWQAACRIP
jgi:hypothetical protein